MENVTAMVHNVVQSRKQSLLDQIAEWERVEANLHHVYRLK